MSNRAWCALGSAAVLVTAAIGCDRGARGQRVGALATAVVGDDAGGDDSGAVLEFDAAEEPTVTPEAEAPVPEAEAPEAESIPDAVAVVDVGGTGDENDPDVGNPSSGDDSSGSSSSGGSGSGSGSGGGSSSSSGGGSGSSSGIIIIYIEAGSVAPPSQTDDASPEAASTPDAGNEAASPTIPDSGRETAAPHGYGWGLRVPASVSDQGNSSGSGDDANDPSLGDDSGDFSSAGDDGAPPWGVVPSGDDGGSPNLDLPPSQAVIGCAGCSVPDAANTGALAWLMVALTVGLRTWRRRR